MPENGAKGLRMYACALVTCVVGLVQILILIDLSPPRFRSNFSLLRLVRFVGRRTGIRRNCESMSRPGHGRTRRLPVHYCIFQGDDTGVGGWSRDEGGRRNRWDTLLDTALKCLMMDGEWPRDVRVSIFVGADAVHLTGEIQSLIMPKIGTSPLLITMNTSAVAQRDHVFAVFLTSV
jgi:hypothetical protein